MVSIDKISDRVIMLGGCVSYDSIVLVTQAAEVADNYLQLVVASDSVLPHSTHKLSYDWVTGLVR